MGHGKICALISLETTNQLDGLERRMHAVVTRNTRPRFSSVSRTESLDCWGISLALATGQIYGEGRPDSKTPQVDYRAARLRIRRPTDSSKGSVSGRHPGGRPLLA